MASGLLSIISLGLWGGDVYDHGMFWVMRSGADSDTS